MAYNTQGEFLNRDTWSPAAHHKYVSALLNDDPEGVEEACREIIRNAICFIRELHLARDIPNVCLDLGYNACFIATIFSVEGTGVDGYRLKSLESHMDLINLIRYFDNYVYFCKVKEKGIKAGIAVKILAKLGEVLRCEAMALTTKAYRSLRSFVEGPISSSLDSAIGCHIDACINHMHRAPGMVLFPPAAISCDQMLQDISREFGVPMDRDRSESL